MSPRLPVALLVVFAVTVPARGQTPDPMNPDRPGVSNGASTVGGGRLQVEIGGSVFSDQGDHAFDTLPIALRYGIGKVFEVRLESDTVSIHGRDRGVADLIVGGKWTFHAGNPILGMMVRARVPTGSRPFREEAVTPDFTLLANVPLGQRWSVEANVAVAVLPVAGEDRIAQWTYAETVGATVTPKLQLFGELASIGADARNGKRQVLADSGIAYALKSDLVFDLDVTAGLSSKAPDWGLTGGVSVRF